MKDKILRALTAALQAQYGCNVSEVWTYESIYKAFNRGDCPC